MIILRIEEPLRSLTPNENHKGFAKPRCEWEPQVRYEVRERMRTELDIRSRIAHENLKVLAKSEVR